MKTEKEIREMLEVHRTLIMVIHPATVTLLEWVLDEGNSEDQEWLYDILRDQARRHQEKNKILKQAT